MSNAHQVAVSSGNTAGFRTADGLTMLRVGRQSLVLDPAELQELADVCQTLTTGVQPVVAKVQAVKSPKADKLVAPPSQIPSGKGGRLREGLLHALGQGPQSVKSLVAYAKQNGLTEAKDTEHAVRVCLGMMHKDVQPEATDKFALKAA